MLTRAWQNLTIKQQQYLLQVRPPGDILPEVIKTLVKDSKIKNVAILYDKTFGKVQSSFPDHLG